MLTNPAYKGEPASGRYRYVTDESRVGQIGRADRPIKTARVLQRRDESEWKSFSAPPIVPTNIWDAVQQRHKDNRNRAQSNIRRSYMLSGLVVCPACAKPMMLKGRTTKSGVKRVYICSHHEKSVRWTGVSGCEKLTIPVPVVEASVIRAINDACEHPEAVFAAESAYRQNHSESEGDDLRHCLVEVDLALSRLGEEEKATVSAQVAGIRAGASPDIAARRKDLENRRGFLSSKIRLVQPDSQCLEDWRSKVLTDINDALTGETTTTEEKRKLVRIVVDKVVCRADGADVYFYGDAVKNISVTQYSPVLGLR